MPSHHPVSDQSQYNHCQWMVGRSNIMLSLQGSEGVEQVLQILKDEFKLAMTLSGRVVHIAVAFKHLIVCFAS